MGQISGGVDSLVQQGVTCVTRLRLDAALYTLAPPRQPRTIGWPLTKGERLPTLAKVPVDQTTAWQRVVVSSWYGEGDRVVEICSDTAVWRHSGLPIVPIRWVLLRDPGRRFDPQALLCTDLAQEPLQIDLRLCKRRRLVGGAGSCRPSSRGCIPRHPVVVMGRGGPLGLPRWTAFAIADARIGRPQPPITPPDVPAAIPVRAVSGSLSGDME
ncbi:hypothetical protein E2C06_36185 [Dankookia rubra]|uniref:Uncharacterized protein n=1 Tax=Dankookia rubra TaxID=1442381 RepID=A0A4R5Q289_9PROT|nr:hypothetical protein E2C06_36185 [Dankookia rubra]